MADETTYDSEMNQATHRPGMHGAVNRGARAQADSDDSDRPPRDPDDRTDASGNRVSSDRPSVRPGHVDPFSIKGDPAPKSPPPAATSPDTADGSGTGGRQREAKMMGEVDQASTG
jgi:hypothetical protein